MLFIGADKTLKEILERGEPRRPTMLRFSSLKELKELDLPEGLVEGPERLDVLEIKHRALQILEGLSLNKIDALLVNGVCPWIFRTKREFEGMKDQQLKEKGEQETYISDSQRLEHAMKLAKSPERRKPNREPWPQYFAALALYLFQRMLRSTSNPMLRQVLISDPESISELKQLSKKPSESVITHTAWLILDAQNAVKVAESLMGKSKRAQKAAKNHGRNKKIKEFKKGVVKMRLAGNFPSNAECARQYYRQLSKDDKRWLSGSNPIRPLLEAITDYKKGRFTLEDE